LEQLINCARSILRTETQQLQKDLNALTTRLSKMNKKQREDFLETSKKQRNNYLKDIKKKNIIKVLHVRNKYFIMFIKNW